MFFSYFMLFTTFLEFFFLGIQIFFLKNNYFSFNVFFMFFYAQNIEKCPFTYWLNGRWFLQIVDIHVGNFNMKLTGRWFPQIVDRDSGNLYPIYIKQKLWCQFLNLFAGDLGRLSCLVFLENIHLAFFRCMYFNVHKYGIQINSILMHFSAMM